MAGRPDTPEDRQAREAAGLSAPDDLAAPATARAARGNDARPGRRSPIIDDVEVLTVADTPQRPNPYGRRDGVPNALVASAARIGLNDRRAIENTRRRRQAWQTEAWDYFDEIGEIGYTDTFLANLMSKLRLYPAVRPDPQEAPLSVDDDHSGVDPAVAKLAIDTLARLKSVEGGQSAILRELSLNLEVAGECYLHGHVEEEFQPDPDEPPGPQDYPTAQPTEQAGGPEGPNPNDVEDWQIRSVDELVIVGDVFSLRRGPGVKVLDPIPKNDLVIRIWERHPRFSEMATCAMRRVLAEAEALLLLSREVRATSKSRLSNGLLLIPSELSFGPIDPTRDSGDGEATDDPFDAELQEAMITPIQEEGSASAVVPLTLRGPAEHLQAVRHLTLDKGLDPVLDARIEARIVRIARGKNMPVEIMTGSMNTTFNNQVQIRRSVFDDHIEPRAVLVCDAITSGYFQWALEAVGVEPEVARTIFVWFDASAVVEVPDPAEQAQAAHKDMLISDQAYRRYLGYSEDDAPDDDEKLVRLMLNAPRMDPSILGQILVRSGLFGDLKIPGPASGILGEEKPVSAMPISGTPTPPPPKELPPPADGKTPPGEGGNPPKAATGKPPAPVAASGTPGEWAQLGHNLSSIDQMLRARIIAKLDEAMQTTLERAGNRVRTRLARDKGALRKVESVPPRQLPAALGEPVVRSMGLSEAELLEGAFNTAVADIAVWLAGAHQAALRAVERAAGPLPGEVREEADQEHARNVTAAVAVLQANLRALAGQRIYNPKPAAGPGEHDGTVTIPAGLVRAALGAAGGATPRGGSMVTGENAVSLSAATWQDVLGNEPVTDGDGGPVGGVGTGPTVMGVVHRMGGRTEMYRWEYGQGVRSEFMPHHDLDGQTAPRPSGFQWPSSYSGWPENSVPFPGDHDGCVCDLTPILVSASGEETTEQPEDIDYSEESEDTGDTEGADEVTDTGDDLGGEEPGGYVASTLDPDEFADQAGWERLTGTVTDDDIKTATAALGDVRAEIKEAARRISQETRDWLISNDMERLASLRKEDQQDWYFEDLSADERGRLVANGWVERESHRGHSLASQTPDEIGEKIAYLLGVEGKGEQNVDPMLLWVQQTRLIDAAQAMANGRMINPDRFGGMDFNQIIESRYDLTVLFQSKPLAARMVAETNAMERADDALEILGQTVGGPAPYEMTEAGYLAELDNLEAEVANLRPEHEDEYGPVYSPADQATLNRVRTLMPPGLDDGTQTYDEMYREIIQVAREGGLI